MKPSVLEVLPAVRAVYSRHGAGCCLHITLDDGNISDDHVRFCVRMAVEAQHPECQALAETLLMMSKTQRAKLYNIKHRGPK